MKLNTPTSCHLQNELKINQRPKLRSETMEVQEGNIQETPQDLV